MGVPGNRFALKHDSTRVEPTQNPENLGRETSYPDWVFSWFFSVFPGECRDNTLKLGHDPLSKFFQILPLLITISFNA
jgi:hypothetical protein